MATSAPIAAATANVGNSNKSTPTPTVAAPKNVTKWVLLIVVAIAVIVGIALLVASVKRDHVKVAQAIPQHVTRSEVPFASSPQSSWPKLVIPAGGRSDVSLPNGMHHITVIGNNYRLHSVYQGGRECSSFGQETCPDGPVASYYVMNELNKTNTIIYAFVPN